MLRIATLENIICGVANRKGGDKLAVKQNIIKKRKELGLTQKAVADGAGITRSSYTAIERGLRYPSLETALRICAVLKMPVDKAFSIDENKKQKG